MSKTYNTPKRSHIVKTRLDDEEYSEFLRRLEVYGMNQSEFLRQAITGAPVRPIITVHPVNDELLSALGKITAEYGKIGSKYDGEYYERHDEEIESILENYGQGYQVYHPNVKKLDFRSFLCGKETHDTPIIRKILSWAGIQEKDVYAFLFTTRYEEFFTIHVKVQMSTKELSLFTFVDEEYSARL